jgi:acetyl-CoA carboxylase carboxyl transferase subunit alpha
VSEAWTKVKLAREPNRPHTLDYIAFIFDDFLELRGDRLFAEDPALVGGIARLGSRSVAVVGHQKGRDTRENLKRNFGMPKPEGYRKAVRIMKLAADFEMPVISFIDTPAADPSLQSEERGQAMAIGDAIRTMLSLPVPTLAVVIGEGGSGGALAIGAADQILMLENAIYSVASPEACAAILWHDASQAPRAAQALKITAQDLLALGVVDRLVPEPPGGAHLAPDLACAAVKEVIEEWLNNCNDNMDPEVRLNLRYEKFRRIGCWLEA